MSDAPLHGLRVLVTRERAASERFAGRLEKLGAAPVLCPAIEIQFRDPPKLDEALATLERFDWLALTSANAVRALERRFERLSHDPAASLARIRIAVVGSKTNAALERIGGRADVISRTGDAVGLADALEAVEIEAKRVLFPASSIAGPELPRRLREAGADIVQIAVYDTVAPESLSVPPPEELDVATFASPSAVQHIGRVVGRDWFRRLPVICIGKTTAAAARDAGSPEPRIAPETTMAGLITALLQFQQRKLREVEHHGAL